MLATKYRFAYRCSRARRSYRLQVASAFCENGSVSRRSLLIVQALYRELSISWGPQHWWPAETRFEVIVGAYLTQNTAWINVTRALDNLRNAGLLNIPAVRTVRIEDLELMVRPAGYFRQKARRLKTFIAFLDAEYGGNLDHMFSQDTAVLRQQLLALNGVGPETADSILLYAGDHPVFVVDAYTRRIFERHEIVQMTASYDDIRQLVEAALSRMSGAIRPGVAAEPRQGGAVHPPSPVSTAPREDLAQVYNEMHALIVGIGKNFCFKNRPDCESCPLRRFLPRPVAI